MRLSDAVHHEPVIHLLVFNIRSLGHSKEKKTKTPSTIIDFKFPYLTQDGAFVVRLEGWWDQQGRGEPSRGSVSKCG